jgi:hypothetical protein
VSDAALDAEVRSIATRTDIPPDERRRLVARRRAEVTAERVRANGLPVTVTLGAYRVTVAEVTVDDVAVSLLGVEVRRRNGAVLFVDDFRWVNPPLLVPDPAGAVIRTDSGTERRFRVDPGAVVLRDLLEVIEHRVADPALFSGPQG